MTDFSKYNLTPSSKNALSKAKEKAKKCGHLKVIDIHLLWAIMQIDHNNIDFCMESMGFIKPGFTKALSMVLDKYKEPKRKKEIYAPEIFEILDKSQALVKKNKDEFIGIDHILVVILETRPYIKDFFYGLDINVKNFSKVLLHTIIHGVDYNIPDSLFGAMPTPQPVQQAQQTQKKKQGIEDWCENINKKIEDRGTFEIFGREKESQRSFEILLRKNKSNIILVGEAGVGKTAIVEGLAEKIIQKKCPSFLENKKILSLDMTSLLAGTMYRGQMEDKVKVIIDEISNNEDYILFIDEIHTIIGSGSSEGSLDLANSLKPVLSRGNFACIGATTKEEYNRYFKTDSALNRRFEKVDVLEPTQEQTLELIKKAKLSYEKFHKVKFSLKILKTIIDLCEEYLPEKKFPDKAFDIIDEAGAKTKIENKGETVNMNTIYKIFSEKLNTTIENVKENKNIELPGRIGF